jgi:hypothetical protein
VLGPRPSRTTYLWSFTLRDLVFIALMAALAVVAKLAIRMPLHVPGHSGVLWVAVFIVCRGLVDKRGTGVLLGVVAGVLATFAGLGDSGPLEWVKWLAAGLVLELLVLALPGDLRSWLKAGIVGAGLHLGKLAGLTLAGIILRVPFALLVLGLGWSATTHVVFGAAGGLLGALVLRELLKVPFLRPRALEQAPDGGSAPRCSSLPSQGREP